MKSQHRRALALGASLLLLGAALLMLGAGIGSTGFESMLAARHDPVAWQIVSDIRLPRTLGAWLAGALLGFAGAVAQGLFRNPLADPYLLGSASGASLGVAAALWMFGASPASTQWVVRLGMTGAAFLGAVCAVMLTLLLARGVQQTLRLLLAGVIVGVVLGALKDLITIASADILQAIQGFMLGSTGLVGWSACAVMAGVGAVCLLFGWALAPVLDGLALATGAAVAQTGLIAFVGLAAPHLVRSAVKTTHARLVLLSGAMGGLLLMAADLLARWLIAPQELPVGVLTAVLGGTYLLWLMHRRSARGGL